MIPQQQDLFPRAPLTPETFAQRLPSGDWLTVSDICAAYGGLSENVVYTWIEAREIHAIDCRSSGATKAFWKCMRQSVVDHFHRRLSGAPTEKHKKGPTS